MAAPADSLHRVRDYHDADFDYGELADELEVYTRRCAELAPGMAAAAAVGAPAQADYYLPPWQAFHRRHRGRFFKPRYYIAEAFPLLRSLTAADTVLEVGCGNGSNLFVLAARTPAQILGTDASRAALEGVRATPEFGAISHRTRLALFDAVADVWAPLEERHDAAPPNGGAPPVDRPQGTAAAALMTFVLSALRPGEHAAAVAAVARTLRPGGALLFRDYAHGDLAQLRAEDGAVLAPRLHVRGDGTLAYFFELEELRALFASAGLRVEELRFCTVRNVNRRKGVVMRRVWVHGVAVKPPPSQTAAVG
jgi:SAM-dependent methyltransferase